MDPGDNLVSYLSVGELPVAIDERIDIYINNVHYTTLYTTPTLLREAALGLVIGDGLAKSMEDVAEVNVDRGRVNVQLRGNPRVISVVVDDCGIAPGEGGAVDTDVRVRWDQVLSIIKDFNLRTASVRLGLAMHTSGAYGLNGERLAIVHDTSRHVSIIKLIGLGLMRGIDFSKSIVLTTGRASSDMVVKLARVGVPIVVSMRGPLYSGYVAALKLGITLVVNLRRGKVRGLVPLTYWNRLIGPVTKNAKPRPF